ncbi:MAG: tetratricopeptide repeat protein, partial [Hyphomicrobiales bacterium]
RKEDREHGIADLAKAIALEPANAKKGCSEMIDDIAITGCNAAIDKGQGDAEVYNMRGLKYLAKDDKDRAIADFSKAIELNGKYAPAFYNRARSSSRPEDQERVKADMQKAVELDPELGKQGCSDLSGALALQACDLAIAKFPKDATLYNDRGAEYMDQNDMERALADLSKAIELDRKYARAYKNRADIYRDRGDYEDAVADYSNAIQNDAKYAGAYNGRCWLRAISNRELPQALGDCDEALRLRPNAANYLDSRGLVFLRLGRIKEAIADYDAALKEYDKLAGSLYGRGLAKRKIGDVAGGDADIARAKQIRPEVADEFKKYGLD